MHSTERRARERERENLKQKEELGKQYGQEKNWHSWQDAG